MSEKRDITFRRIRGRIVPIKMKKRQKDVATGAALIAGGAALGAQFGRIAAAMNIQSAHTENVSRQLAFRFSKAKNIGLDTVSTVGTVVTHGRVKSFRIFSSRLKLLKFGKVGAAALIGVGLTKLFEGATGKDPGAAGEVVGHVAGTAAGFAVLSPYYARLSGKAGAFAHAFRAVKGIPKHHLPKKKFF